MNTENSNPYRLPHAVKSVLERWWNELRAEDARGQVKADRAVLKRAHDLQAIVESSAYQRIYQKLLQSHVGDEWKPYQQDRLAALAGLLAHLKAPSENTLAKVMGTTNGDQGPAVSELRFRRLLDASDMDALFTALRRVLPLIDHGANAMQLMEDLFAWNDHVKRRWAYAYYGAAAKTKAKAN